MRPIEAIVIHCTATPSDMNIGAAEIREWHLARGWSDIGYHYVVRRSGESEKGRPLSRIGAHVKGFNEESIGIALVGGVAEDRWTPENNFTEAQFGNALELCAALMKAHEIPRESVLGHNEVIRDITHTKPMKACPCFDMGWFREQLYAKTVRTNWLVEAKEAFDLAVKHRLSRSSQTHYTLNALEYIIEYLKEKETQS